MLIGGRIMRGIIVAGIFIAAILGIPGETTAMRILQGSAVLYAFVLVVPPFRSFQQQIIWFVMCPLFVSVSASVGCLIGTGIGWGIAAFRGSPFGFGDVWIGGACGALIAAWGGMGAAKILPDDRRRVGFGLLFGGVLSATVTTACSVAGGWKPLLAGAAICVHWAANYVAGLQRICRASPTEREEG